MKIAATYDSGNIFPHFGRTETFKIYEVKDGSVLSSEVIGTNGVGHEALAGLLADLGVSLLICGGMGQGAQEALSEAGIVMITGAEGNADEAVEAFLRGELTTQGVNCDHHHGEEHHHEEEGQDGGCCGESGCGAGGCAGCSGCGPQVPLFDGKNVGRICRVHYTGTFNDGSKFDSSYDRGEPLEFICGAGMMIEGFDRAVANLEVGEVTDVHLMPEEAYGMPDPEAVFTVLIAELPGSEDLEAGQQVYLTNDRGQPFPVTVAAKDDTTVTFDANHAMAGKELNFRIELVEVK